MPVNRNSDRYVWLQIADKIRDDVAAGVLWPGKNLPSEAQLQGEFGVGREVVRQALCLLRFEALIRTARGVGSVVRTPPEKKPLKLKRGETATIRMTTQPERRDMEWDEGVPMLVVTRTDGSVEILQADTVVLTG
jgi:DNA-binding GntR family transcriptional regulator